MVPKKSFRKWERNFVRMVNAKAIVIGGSAGSFKEVTTILGNLKPNFDIPILMGLHRLKHVRNGFVEALELKSKITVIEPYDKENLQAGVAYLAPANYHMLVELGNRIALSTEDLVNHSRPSIDLLFYSAAYTYQANLVGIILSGANTDGAKGLKAVKDRGGYTIVQDIDEAKVARMPEAASQTCKPDSILKTNEIVEFLNNLTNKSWRGRTEKIK